MANDNTSEQQCDFDSSWSRYQIMVLQQLGDHTQVLQNLHNDVIEHKQAAAVHLAEFTMWKARMDQSIDELQKAVDEIMYDDKGVNKRVNALEQQQNTENQIELRAKTSWQTTSAFIVTMSVVINLIIQLFMAFVKK
jgi:hypothetical protein